MENLQKPLSRKEWRKLQKKLRRKRIRQKAAQERDRLEQEAEARKLANPNYVAYLREKEQLEQEMLNREAERSRYENALWLDREREVQLAFEERRRKQEEAEREEREKRERIRKEFEEMERKAREARAEKERLMEEYRRKQQERERMLAEYLAGIEDHVGELCEMVHTRVGKEACSFFTKVGACRYGVRCSSDHPVPGLSELLLIPNFFAHPALDQQQHPEYGLDASIEFDDDELYRCFKEFFSDIIEEFEEFGSIKGVFVSRNFEPHLRGNVYVQYERLRDSARAYQRMNGRFYASKQLRVEFRSPIAWSSAVCGLFEKNRCQKGKSCNYLHLLVNPVRKYRYDHMKELQSTWQSQRMSQRAQLVERSWDDIDLSVKHKTNWRWSETPEVEIAPRGDRRSHSTAAARSDFSPSQRDSGKHSRSSSRQSSSYRDSNRSRRSRSRSRSSRRSRSRESHSKRSKRRSRSRSSDRRRNSSDLKKRSRRSRSRESVRTDSKRRK